MTYRPLPPKPYYARKLTLTERWRKLFPGSVVPPRPNFKLPFLSQEKTDQAYLIFLLGFIHIKKWRKDPYWQAGVFFCFAGYYATLLPFYKDQFVSYGCPGLYPIQKQNLTTFQFVTAPTAVNEARRLGMKISESVENESPVIQFLETPFLKRLDLYPHAALFEMSPQWATLLGENYTALLHNHKKTRNQYDRIPCTQSLSTIHPIDYQPSHILHRLDPWARQRFFFDLADEVPTRLQDAFGLYEGLSRQSPPPYEVNMQRYSGDHGVPNVNLPERSFGSFTVKPVDILALQTGSKARNHVLDRFMDLFYSKASKPSNWIYGVPSNGTFLERQEGLKGNLPAYMVDLDRFLPQDSDETATNDSMNTEMEDVDVVPAGLNNLINGPSPFHKDALLEVDDTRSNLSSPSDLHSSSNLPSLLRVASSFAPDSLQPYPFDFVFDHPVREPVPAFDLFSLTDEEAAMSPPPPLPPAPEPPTGYEAYRKRLDLFKKKEQKGPLIDAINRLFNIAQMEESLIAEEEEARQEEEGREEEPSERVSEFVPAFMTLANGKEEVSFMKGVRDYYEALDDYRTKKLKIQAAERQYAPVREKIQDLRNYWNEVIPRALLDYLQKMDLRTDRGDDVNPDKDWFSHGPMTREDWELFISKTISLSRMPKKPVHVTRRKEPFRLIPIADLTVDDIRTVMKYLFGGVDFANLSPSELRSGFLSQAFYQTLDKNTRPDVLKEDKGSYGDSFYRLLRQHGLAAKLKLPTRSFLRYVFKYKSIPPPDQMSDGEMKPNRILRARAFYKPITDWLDNKGSRFELPEGTEFHWALHAQKHLLYRLGLETPERFAEHIATELAKLDRRYGKMLDLNSKGISLEERLAKIQLGEQLRLTIHQKVQSYLSRVSTAPFMRLIDVQISPFEKAFGPDSNFPFRPLDYGVTKVDRREVAISLDDFIYRLKLATLTRRASSSFMSFMNRQSGFGPMRQYRQDWRRPSPQMSGFLFPDTASTFGRQLQLAAARYRISSSSLWESFAAMTSLRPLEVALPPGYRLFVSRSLPDFSRPRSVIDRWVNIFPSYGDIPRRHSELPPYEVLKEFYPDLDVSFLPKTPKPADLYLAKTTKRIREAFDADSDEASDYKNYFEYSQALARQNGDLDISPTILRWLYDYYLGSQNWIKDMPRDFLGLQGLTHGNSALRFLRLMHREQVMNFFTPFQKRYVFGPFDLDDSRLPSQLEDVNIPAKLYPESWQAPAMESRFHNKRARRQFGLVFKKKKAALDSFTKASFPELSMDEWHDLFKLSIDRARRSSEAILNLDLPPIQPVAYQLPTQYAGKIHVNPSAAEPKQRSQALAQILLLASTPKTGAYNLLDYVDPRAVHTAHPAATPGMRRDLLPIFWHSPVLSNNKMVENTARDLTLRNKRPFVEPIPHFPQMTQVPNVSKTWENAESFLSARRPNAILGGLEEELVYDKKLRSRLEPVTIYSFFVGTQLFLIPITTFLMRLFVTMAIRDFIIDYLYMLHRRFWESTVFAMGIRKCVTYCIRFLKPKRPRFRVFKNIERRFSDLVGTEPAVFSGAAKIAVTLRNRGRGGPQSSKGALLYGPPGNGKTFLVQAIGGEANVPVIAVTSSELLDTRRTLFPTDNLEAAFKMARKMAPCILFIDEIDGLGRKRSSLIELQARTPHPVEDGLLPFVRTVPPRVTFPFNPPDRESAEKSARALTANPLLVEKELREKSLEGLIDLNRFNIDNDEPEDPMFRSQVYEQPESVSPAPHRFGRLSTSKSKIMTDPKRVALLTSFLQLMDKLRPYHGVVVIGATNRLEAVDPAVRRQGRLDRRIHIPAPTEERRIEIMRFYVDRLGSQEEIPWDYMADRTRGYCVADLETMVNQSAIIAIRQNEGHSLLSLEDAIEGVTRHRHIRENLTPFPIRHKLPAHDPLFFVRSAYYQASRALVYNILPDHPTLPFAQLNLEHFVPDVPIHELLQRPYTLADLEDRLTATLAGKAGEFLLLYGSPLKDQTEINERQTWESSLGADELNYALELAYAIVDQWLIIDDFRLPIRQALELTDIEGTNDENFFEPGGDPGRPHFLRYNLAKETKLKRRVRRLHSSMFDRRSRVYSTLADTLRWFGGAKASLNVAREEFRKPIELFEKTTFFPTIGRKEIWNPVEQYYGARPYFKFMNDPADETLNKPNPNEEQMNDVVVRPTYPDLMDMDRDYIMQTLLLKCFNNALELVEKHRTVIERMADHLLKRKKLRSFEMYAYIQAYTAELRELKPETKVRSEPAKGMMPALDTYRRQPESRLRTINGREVLVIDQSWGPESNKLENQSIPTSIIIDGPESSVWSGQSLLDKSKPPAPSTAESGVGQPRYPIHPDYIARSAKISKLYSDFFNQKVSERSVIQDDES